MGVKYIKMKINYAKWKQVKNNLNPVYVSEIMKYAKLANEYSQKEERDENLERKFLVAIRTLVRNEVLELEEKENWKEQMTCFYDFCKAV